MLIPLSLQGTLLYIYFNREHASILGFSFWKTKQKCRELNIKRNTEVIFVQYLLICLENAYLNSLCSFKELELLQ
jgi:hypothetical protein